MISQTEPPAATARVSGATPPGTRPLPLGLRRRTALSLGYATIIALLVFASIEAYWAQDAVSHRHIEIYRQYVQQDAAISQLRRALWLTGNDVRDFFINTTPVAAVMLKSQLAELKQQSQAALDQLERIMSVSRTHPELAVRIRDFWLTVDPIPDTLLAADDPEQYEFLQREFVPRRSALYDSLLTVTEAGLVLLQQSEVDFARTRRAAGRNLIVMLGLCVVLGLLVARVSLRYAEHLERETKRQYEEVAHAKRNLEQLSARLLEIEEGGRKKLSRELHDEIGQALAILQIEIANVLKLGAGQSPAIEQRLQRAHNLAEKTVQTVRNMALVLRPTLLDDLGLVPALQWHLEDFIRRSGISCDFSEDGVEDRLPDAVKTCVYRVVQEALHNCEKHAGASRIKVVLRRLPEALTVEVEDNGRGFEWNPTGTPQNGAGLGILGMRERAAYAGGSLSVDSAPGRGTRLSLRIPLPAPAAGAEA